MPPDSEGDYEVGYRKPPGHTRFTKGRSGNRDRHPDLRFGAFDPRQQARSPDGAAVARQWRADPPPNIRGPRYYTEENAVLTHPMLDQLSQLGLSGMAQAFAELEASDETAA